ncbi:MAG: 4Fe-4S binding protein, partial [Pseudomonadales bacterium]|nr:4Fe-4S binding protein [Pseudomonadales bacterium]
GFAVARKRWGDLEPLAGEIGSLLHRIDGGVLRSHPDTSTGDWGSDARDYLAYADDELLDPGDDAAVDVLVVTGRYQPVSVKDAAPLRANGIVVVAGPDTTELASLLSAEFLQAIADKGVRLFHAVAQDVDQEGQVEFALGATFSALIASETMALKERKVFSSRQEVLKRFPEGLRDRLFVAFQQGWDACNEVQPSDVAASPSKKWNDRAPATVRALGRSDNELDSLPRFWDQVGVLYHDNEADELTVDPYLATGTVAPLSATFRDLGSARRQIPVFDPETCTGCGKCWVACPDSAIGPLAISPAELINTGIKTGSADALRQVANQLSARLVGPARQGETA